MSWEQVLAIVGASLGALGSLLGFFNLFWGTNIVGRRKKVKVISPHLKIIYPFDEQDFYESINDTEPVMVETTSISASLSIVQTRANIDYYITFIEFRLKKRLLGDYCKYYTFFPIVFYIRSTSSCKLKKNVPIHLNFGRKFLPKLVHPFDTVNDRKHFDLIVEDLQKSYEIYIIYSDGDSSSYFYPPRLWHRFLPYRIKHSPYIS